MHININIVYCHVYVQKGPTEFASIPVYPDEESFHNESGWFESAPADVSGTQCIGACTAHDSLCSVLANHWIPLASLHAKLKQLVCFSMFIIVYMNMSFTTIII